MFGRRGGSIQLARISGIRIGATPSWFLVLFVFIYLLNGYFSDVVAGSSDQAFILAVVATLLFFASIVFHELGHAVVARRNGIGIAGIELFFFGGVARLSRDAETPGAEFRVAAAGPAGTLVVILACLAAGLIMGESHHVVEAAKFGESQPLTAVEALLGWLAAINLYLLVLNLIPALPLDGGRIARSIAWWRTGDRARATRLAARAGQGFAYLLIGAGVFLAIAVDPITGIWLVIVGMFISQSARAELVTSAFSARIQGITVADVMDREPVWMPADTTALEAQDEFVLRYRYPWFPVVNRLGRYLGVLRSDEIDEAVAGGRPALTAAELVDAGTDARFRIGLDRPLEALLGEPGLRELGALVAVDAEGVMVGVVTLDQVRRALVAASTAP